MPNCVPNNTECKVRCLDTGMCVDSILDCPQRCSSNINVFQCANTLECVQLPQSCANGISCTGAKNVTCWNGLCTNSVDKCTPVPACPPLFTRYLVSEILSRSDVQMEAVLRESVEMFYVIFTNVPMEVVNS